MRNARFVALAFVASLVTLIGCTGSARPEVERTGSALDGSSGVARAYLTRALNVMEANALNRNQLDWPRLRQAAKNAAKDARTPAQTYPAIEMTLRALRDHGHSSLIPPHAGVPTGSSSAAQQPVYEQLPRTVAYVALPADTALNADSRYQGSGRAAVARGIRRHPCGWVLDLRGNLGGNVWPMLMVVQPLLGVGTVAFFVPPGKPMLPVTLTATSALEARKPHASVEAKEVLSTVAAPVAVLTNDHTASSGEAVAIAFRGRPATRSFGTATYGVPTGNRPFRLSDGAIVNLTVVQEADRTGHVYPAAPVNPNVRVEGGPFIATASPADPVLDAAMEWLTKLDQCSS